MKFIKNIILFMKNIFNKQEKIGILDVPKQNKNIDKNNDFIESLKVAVTDKREKGKVETLICEGDGLGIQKKISC